METVGFLSTRYLVDEIWDTDCLPWFCEVDISSWMSPTLFDTVVFWRIGESYSEII